MDNNENEADVSIGTDIPDLDITNEIENQESVHSYELTHEDPSTSSANLDEADDHGNVRLFVLYLLKLDYSSFFVLLSWDSKNCFSIRSYASQGTDGGIAMLISSG